MTARSIGELIAPILARAKTMQGLQDLLSHVPAAAHRKELIMAAHGAGAIDDEQCELLIQVYMLETA